MSIIALIIFLAMSVGFSAMVAAYGTLSTAHLRHWARMRDPAAQKLYPLKARGSAALLTIELLRAVSIGISVALLAVRLSPWLTGFILVLIVFGIFVLLSQLYFKPFGMQLLVWLSAPILSITHALKPVLLPLGRVLDKYLDEEPVALTRSDLSKMLSSVAPEDTDLSSDEITMLARALEFERKIVYDLMVPKRHLMTVPVTEILTPVIVNELHTSGQDYFPVMDEQRKTAVGVLAMQDITDITHHATVADAMQRAQFVGEDEPLKAVLQAFYTTKQQVFIVLNGTETMMGIISLEVVLAELVGMPALLETASEPAEEVPNQGQIAEPAPGMVE
jgi:CBS domain containing-hemolysin-like protein